MKSRILAMFYALFFIGIHAIAQNPLAPLPRLICGTDNSGFSGKNGQLAEVQTAGSSIVGPVHLYNLAVPVNGVTVGNGFLWTGQPEDVGSAVGNTLRSISTALPPTVLTTVLPGANSFSSSCCNEQMVLTSDGFYHVHYSDVIQRLVRDSSGNSKVVQTYPQSDVVGIATDGTNIWISKFAGRQVGTWDPATNTFTAVFSTPSNAGALAWDVTDGVLWVGMGGLSHSL